MKKLNPAFKWIFFILLITTKGVAQNCDNTVLFKKGATLEYRTYMPKKGIFSSKGKFFETTRLSYFVADVVDSAGVTSSYITKKGISAEREKNTYEKKYILTCKDGKIYFPVDFYTADTIFLSDIHPGLKSKKVYSASSLKENALQYFSIDPGKNDFGFVDKKSTSNIVIKDYGWESRSKNGGYATGNPADGPNHFEASSSISTNEFVVVTTVKNMKSKGKEKVIANDQAYDCIKVETEMEATFLTHKNSEKNSPIPNLTGKSIPQKIIFFYNETMGLIKSTAVENSNAGYIELYKVTLPK